MTRVWITHPETGGVQIVTDEARAEVWEPRGWTPVSVDYAAASAVVGGPVVRPDQLTETYVRELVAAQQAAVAAPPAPEPVETTTTSTRRAGRTKAEETV